MLLLLQFGKLGVDRAQAHLDLGRFQGWILRRRQLVLRVDFFVEPLLELLDFFGQVGDVRFVQPRLLFGPRFDFGLGLGDERARLFHHRRSPRLLRGAEFNRVTLLLKFSVRLQEDVRRGVRTVHVQPVLFIHEFILELGALFLRRHNLNVVLVELGSNRVNVRLQITLRRLLLALGFVDIA